MNHKNHFAVFRVIKQLICTAFSCLLFNIITAQVGFTGNCTHIKNNEYRIVLRGRIEKDWRIYIAGDTSINFSIDWADASIKNSGSSTISNTLPFTDKLFDDKILQVVQKDFDIEQPVKIDGTPPALLQVKIKGFAANKESFVPIDQTFSLYIEGGVAREEKLKIDAVDLNHPLSACGEQQSNANWWMVFLRGFTAGLLALLMPCIFPMIPVTISVFTHKANGFRNSMLYGLSIVGIYVLASLPFHLINGLNPQILNSVSTSAGLNLVFFFIFVAFALSLFGLFEIRLPAAFGNSAASKSGIFFMALTLCIISFSCTGPILGFLLASSIDAGAWPLTIGMFGFGLALALPFSLLALFPQWLKKLPKSGGWMETLKKVFAFIELGFALKFLSNADLVRHWGLLSRQTFIICWLVLSLSLAIYLLARARGSWFMGLLSFVFFGFCFYLAAGLSNGSELPLLSGFPPPAEKKQNAIVNDYAKALRLSKQLHKPILIDFTGWACVNCRKMEENVWSRPAIKELLQNKFILVSLYVDDRANAGSQGTIGEKWASFESINFKQSTQPLYVILSEHEQLLNNPVGYTPDENLYKQWLQCGLQANSTK